MLDIDLRPLKQTAVLKFLSDNSRQVCPYEHSGECRDKNCENLHLSHLSTIEPDGASVFLCAQVADPFIASTSYISP